MYSRLCATLPITTPHKAASMWGIKQVLTVKQQEQLDKGCSHLVTRVEPHIESKKLVAKATE